MIRIDTTTGVGTLIGPTGLSGVNSIAIKGTVTGISSGSANSASRFVLHPASPNPFNPSTTIRYEIPKTGQVQLTVFNMLGQVVRALVNEEKRAGTYSVEWDGRNDAGNVVGSGVYLYRLQAGSSARTMKMILMK